jgi:ABC-2 type transport system permease protein
MSTELPAGGMPAGATAGAGTADASRIHDLGYRRYTGVRLGRGHRLLALYLHSLRGSFGIGRGAKAKILPFAILAIVSAPAVVSVAITAVTGEAGLAYAEYPFQLQLPIVIFLGAQASEMLSRDLRFKVLPLYFSRPAQRDDYAWAKLGAMVTALFALMGLPLLILYVGMSFATDKGLDGVWDQTSDFLPGLANVLVHALVLGAVGLAVASFSKRRAFGTGAVVGLFLVTNAITGFGSAADEEVQPLFGLVSPFFLLDGFKDVVLRESAVAIDPGSESWLYVLGTLGLLVVGVVVLLARYRKAAS